MNVLEMIKNRRSVRRFKNIPIENEILLSLIEHARLSVSGMNKQPIHYAVIAGKKRDEIFSCFKFASYIKDYKIAPDERPQAFIVLYAKNASDFSAAFEAGAVTSTMLLAAMEYGISGCPLGIADKEKLKSLIPMSSEYTPVTAVALGYAAHGGKAVSYNGDFKYRIDENGNFLVPKKETNEFICYSDTILEQ